MKKLKESKTITIRVPADLHSKISELVDQRRINRNQLLNQAVSEFLADQELAKLQQPYKAETPFAA